MSDNIFQGQTTDQQQTSGVANPQPSNDNTSFADLLGNIKNEKGEPKYRDLPTALDALRHSQEFIPQLRNENDTLKRELEDLRAQVTKLNTVEETLQRLTSTQQQQPPQAAQGLDEKSIAELVNRTLTAKEQEAIKKSNIQTVVNAMQSRLGVDAEKTFYSKAAELGMQPADINSLAASNPKAVLKLLGIEDVQTTHKVVTPTTSGVNTSGYQQKPDTLVRKNDKPVLIGATSNDLLLEARLSKDLVTELHNQGLSTSDLTNPKEFFKYFS